MDILHDKVDVLLIVEGLDEANNIRKYNFFQNLFLLYDTFLKFLILDILLRNTFDSIKIGAKLNILD